MTKELVLFDHDGGVDDFLSLALLLSMEHVETVGVVLTPADTYVKPAVNVTRRIMDLMGFSHIPVAESTVRGLNPFPRAWRQHVFPIEHFPLLNDKETVDTPLAAESGQVFTARVLSEAPEPVTVLATGPLTTISEALKINPVIEGKVKRIVWMGGALNVPGNVDIMMEPGQDGSMEWNVYWDPPAAHHIWQTTIPLVLCPLDITNHVPVTGEFIRQLSRQRKYPVSELAALCYAIVMKQSGYYFWDVLTTAYLGRPDLYKTQEWETVLIPDGRSQGRTKAEIGGRKVTALDSVNLDGFYQYLLKQWAR